MKPRLHNFHPDKTIATYFMHLYFLSNDHPALILSHWSSPALNSEEAQELGMIVTWAKHSGPVSLLVNWPN